ncbi:unnamed protein product [Discosporangium mesarthrocarpum]
MCRQTPGWYGQGSTPLSSIPGSGQVWYGGPEACCSLCTRDPECVGWAASTIRLNPALVDGKYKCALYSSVVMAEPPEENPSEWGKIVKGVGRAEEAMMMLGPSMTVTRT